MSWIDNLGLRHFDDGGYSDYSSGYGGSFGTSSESSDYSNEGNNYRYQPDSEQSTDDAFAALERMSPEQGRQPTDQENMNAVIREIVQRDSLKSGDGGSWKSGSGADILTGEAARLLQSGQLSWNDIIPTKDKPNPDYHDWVAGDLPNGTPGYIDPKTGKYVYGTSRTGLSYDQLRAMQDQGQGNTQLTDNQNVDQALATMEADKFMNKFGVPLMKTGLGMAIPGASMAMSGLPALAQAVEQKSFDPLKNIGMGLISNKITKETGLPNELVQGALSGNVQGSVERLITGRSMSEIASELSKITGTPAPVVSTMLQAFGVNNDVKSAVTSVLSTLKKN